MKAQLKKEQEEYDLAIRPKRNIEVLKQLDDIEDTINSELTNSDRITIANSQSTEEAIKNTRRRMHEARLNRGTKGDTTQFLEREHY